MAASDKRLLKVLRGEPVDRPPVWMMRQAGRYLPEYRELRSKEPNFLKFCYNPDMATEVTLQPIRRYGFDASIVFADILVIPDALGQKVEFQPGVGPVLEPVNSGAAISSLSMDNLHEHLSPIYETLRRLSSALPRDVALIGFAGAPWTLATYMIAGRSTPGQAPARLMAYQSEGDFQKLIDLLVVATANYLIEQVRAGAEVLQLFDTWAGSLSPSEFRKWCLDPTKKIVERVRAACGDIPIIGFPKGVGPLINEFVDEADVQAVSLDTSMDMLWAREHIGKKTVIQGNLDPLLVVAGGDAMDTEARTLLETFSDHPFIFNLGHGLVPETPPENVARLVELIKRA